MRSSLLQRLQKTPHEHGAYMFCVCTDHYWWCNVCINVGSPPGEAPCHLDTHTQGRYLHSSALYQGSDTCIDYAPHTTAMYANIHLSCPCNQWQESVVRSTLVIQIKFNQWQDGLHATLSNPCNQWQEAVRQSNREGFVLRLAITVCIHGHNACQVEGAGSHTGLGIMATLGRWEMGLGIMATCARLSQKLYYIIRVDAALDPHPPPTAVGPWRHWGAGVMAMDPGPLWSKCNGPLAPGRGSCQQYIGHGPNARPHATWSLMGHGPWGPWAPCCNGAVWLHGTVCCIAPCFASFFGFCQGWLANGKCNIYRPSMRAFH